MILPKAILFDMDGTLTDERIDFEALRAALGLEPHSAILEAIALMPPDKQVWAEQILHEYEHNAAKASELNTSCKELLLWLDSEGIGRALITRNTRKSVATVFDRHGLHFEIKITREDGQFKPHPQPLWLACEKLGVKPEEAWMVGDWKYDIEAANAAKIRGVWLSYDRVRPFNAVPDTVVTNLHELYLLLKKLPR